MANRFVPLDKLPLFASEEALATALLGPGRTVEWRAVAPLLEGKGFPRVDGLMGGRYTPAVRAFFDREYEVHGKQQVPEPHRPAEFRPWKKRDTASGRPDLDTTANARSGAPVKLR